MAQVIDPPVKKRGRPAGTVGPTVEGTGKPVAKPTPPKLEELEAVPQAVEIPVVEPLSTTQFPASNKLMESVAAGQLAGQLAFMSEYQNNILKVLSRPTREDEVKTRKGGAGKDLRYISGDSVLKRLIEATRGNYDVDLVEIGENGQRVIFFEIEQGGKKKPAMLVCVRLTVPALGSKIGFGVQILQGGEDMYKGALTDGLKKAATQLGVALDLYDEDFVPETEPEVVPPRKKLSLILKDSGIKTKAAFSEAAIAKFGSDELTDEQVNQWIVELERNPNTPF